MLQAVGHVGRCVCLRVRLYMRVFVYFAGDGVCPKGAPTPVRSFNLNKQKIEYVCMCVCECVCVRVCA